MADYNQTSYNNANSWTPVAGASPFDGNQTTAGDGALDWDSAICCDSTEFTVLPEGDYPFTVTKFERQHHTGSAKMPPCGKAVLTIHLDGGALGTTSVMENLFMHQKMLWKIKQFLVSIGQGKEEDKEIHPRWTEVPGACGLCHVVVQDYQSTKYGDTRQRNAITKFYAPNSGQNARPAGYAYGQSAAAAVAQPVTTAYGAPAVPSVVPAYGTPAAQAGAPMAPAGQPAAPTVEQTTMPLPAAPRRYF